MMEEGKVKDKGVEGKMELEGINSKRKSTEHVKGTTNKQKKKENIVGKFPIDGDANVLIYGLGGVGAQLAKCLVLMGVNILTLQDDREADWCDLSSNPFLGEDDVGENRAIASANKLRTINNKVQINTLTSKLHTPHELSTFRAVVFTDITICTTEEAVQFNEYCRNHDPPIYFIVSQVNGLFGRIFCDFGPEFTAEIIEEKPFCNHEYRSVTTTNADHRMVKNARFDGMKKIVEKYKALPGECDQCARNDNGGNLPHYKSFRFMSLMEALQVEKPSGNLVMGIHSSTACDYAKERPLLLHFAFKALDKFIHFYEHLPEPDSYKDKHNMCKLASSMIKEATPLWNGVEGWPILEDFASGSRSVIAPMASIFGGIAAHEVVKALSKVSQPIFQFLYFDSLDSLPPMGFHKDPTPQFYRYDAQILLFGREIQKKLGKTRLLLVGDGVLGCEVMKNLALMGVSSGINGELVLTHRVPQRSWIFYGGRQSVFEDSYDLQTVPDIASSSGITINNNLNIQTLNQCLEQDFEHVYENTFWDNLDTIIDVTNDLQSVRTISHVSKHFLKPFLFPVISACLCHSIVELPSHGSILRVLHKFPFIWRTPGVEHYLGWARSEFEKLFVQTPRNVNCFLSEHDGFLSKVSMLRDAQSRELLLRIMNYLDCRWHQTFQDCISWARMRFQNYFVDNVRLFIMSNEQNSVRGKNWASIQHVDDLFPPEPLVFSASDADHLKFVKAASILRAKVYGIELPRNVDWAKEVETVLDFSPECEMKALINIDFDHLIGRIEELIKKLPLGFQMNQLPFDTDDDIHMEFITSMFNLLMTSELPFKLYENRAKEVLKRCYHPPLASSYTVAAGLTCLNIYKLIGCGTDEPKNVQNVECNLESPSLLKSAATEAYVYKND